MSRTKAEKALSSRLETVQAYGDASPRDIFRMAVNGYLSWHQGDKLSIVLNGAALDGLHSKDEAARLIIDYLAGLQRGYAEWGVYFQDGQIVLALGDYPELVKIGVKAAQSA